MAWYTAPGGTTCVAAYDAVGAASLADSYTNEANPGTYTAAPGVAPTWAYGTGWTFNGTTQYLTTGVVPTNNQTWSAIIRLSGITNSNGRAYGYNNAIPLYFELIPTTGTQILYRNSGTVAVSAPVTSGVLAVAGTQGYKNGVAEGGTIPNPGANAFTGAVYIGCRNQNGSPLNFMAGSVQAFAIYSGTLTLADVVAITAAMQNLPSAGLLQIMQQHAAAGWI